MSEVVLVPSDDIAPADLFALIERNRPRLLDYFPATCRAISGETTAGRYLERSAEDEQARGRFLRGVVVAGSRELIGLVTVKAIDPATNVAEITCLIDRWQEGKGLMCAAIEEVIGFCRSELELCRVRFLIAASNARARRLADRLAFERESRDGRRFQTGRGETVVLDYYCKDLA